MDGNTNFDEIWRKLKWAKEESWLMGTAISVSGGVAEGDTGTGLLTNHAYGIIGNHH